METRDQVDQNEKDANRCWRRTPNSAVLLSYSPRFLRNLYKSRWVLGVGWRLVSGFGRQRVF